MGEEVQVSSMSRNCGSKRWGRRWKGMPHHWKIRGLVRLNVGFEVEAVSGRSFQIQGKHALVGGWPNGAAPVDFNLEFWARFSLMEGVCLCARYSPQMPNILQGLIPCKYFSFLFHTLFEADLSHCSEASVYTTTKSSLLRSFKMVISTACGT